MYFYNNTLAKHVIFFLTLTVCYLYLVVRELERTRDLEGNITIDQPVLYKKYSTKIPSVIQDICERWGYTIRMVNNRRAAVNNNMDGIAKHHDVYAHIYCDIMSYRLFQNQTSDMILDYLPAINEFVMFKAKLVSNGGKYIPKGFVIPDQTHQFIRYFYAPENKDKRWIQKDVKQRGSVVRTAAEINTDLDLHSASLFQEYIGNPLLLEGRKFSLGVYVAFASGNPMRAYILESSVLFRFCEKEYYPEDLEDEATYVCDSHELFDIKFVLEIEPLKTYRMKYQYTSRKALDAFLNSTGTNPAEVFAQIYDAIHDVLSQSVERVERSSDDRVKYTELTRWDFLIDANMYVHLMEANFHPGFGCKIRPLLGKHCCHHVVYNLFRVMGYERPLQWNNNSVFHIRDADVHILDRKCFSTTCSSCTLMECRLCSHCLTERQVSVFKEVLREHFHRGTTGLVYPYVKRDIGQKHVDSDERINDNRNITVLTHWLEAKCKQHQKWCSRY